MAIEFARVERVSRSQGKNACCKSAYNARDIINDQKTNVIYNFSRLKDNVHHEILLPSYVNEKFKNVQTLSNEVEKIEKRKDSQLYKEYVLALPDDKNISLELKKEMVYEFIKSSRFIEEGLSVQVDIHKPHDGDKNWHAHLLTPTRRFTKDGLGFENKKASDLEPKIRQGINKAFVAERDITPGELWKNVQNSTFEKHGLENRVNEVAKETGIHLGPVRMRGLMNEVAQFHSERENLSETQFKNGNELLDHVSEKSAVFYHEDLKRAVKDIDDKVVQLRLINEATQSERLINLYRDNGTDTGKWTTKEVRGEEERALRIADGIHHQTIAHSDGNKIAIKNLVAENHLSKHQGTALSALVATKKNTSGLRILQGRAGTGKSRVLGQLNVLVKDQQHVIGLSPTHKAVSELKAQGFDDTHTVKGFLFKHRHDRITVPKNSLLVVDEAAMLGTESTLELLKVARASNSEVILSGDDRQLSSIEYGGLFKVFADRYGSATLDEVKRQANKWGKAVSEAFSKGDMIAGLNVLQQHNKLNFSDDAEQSLSALLADWSQSTVPLTDRLIISIANIDVDVLNKGARDILKAKGVIKGREFEIENNATRGLFARGDRIVITETDKATGLKNGDFGTIKLAAQNQFTVSFDHGREIVINPTELNFKHGYAATVFKSQAASINDVYVYHNGFATKHNAYVEMSRHVKDLHFYCNKEATYDVGVLAEQLSLNLEGGASLQYKTAQDFTEKDHSLLGKVRGWINDKAIGMGDKFHQNQAYYEFDKVEPIAQNTIKAVMQDTYQVAQKAVGADYAVTTASSVAASHSHAANNTVATTQASSTHSSNINIKPQKTSTWADDVARVRADLKFNAERVARDLFGEPNNTFSTTNTLRFGEHGKLAIEISGARQGVWHDFSSGKGGDMLALIQREKNVDFKGSFQLAKAYSFANSQPNVVAELPLRKMVKTLTAQEKLEKLNALHRRSQWLEHPTAGVARDYLTKTRGIENLSDLMRSNDIRYVEQLWNDSHRQKQPALVVFAKDDHYKITGAQAVFLDANTHNKVSEGPAKRSFGAIAGSFVTVQEAKHGPTILAEGLETALSLKEANIPGKIVVALGIHNFKNYPVQADEAIIIAKDNDGGNALTDKAIEKAVAVLSETSDQVSTVMPAQIGDFNDVLMKQGKDSIQRQVMPTVAPYFEKAWLTAWENIPDSYFTAKDLLDDKEHNNVVCERENIKSAEKLQQDKAKVQSLFEQSSAITGTMSEKYLSNMGVKLSEVPEQYVRHLTLDDENGKASETLAIFMEDKQGEKIHCRVTHLNDHAQVKTILKEPKAVLGAYDFRESFVPLQTGSQGSPIFYIQSIKEGLELKSKNIDGDIRATVYPGHLEQQSPENDRETWIVASQKTEATQKVAQRLDGYVLTFNKLLSTDLLEWKMEQEKIAVEEKIEAQKSAEMAASKALFEKESVIDVKDNVVSNTLEKSPENTITAIDQGIANENLLDSKAVLQSKVGKIDHNLDSQDASAIQSDKSSAAKNIQQTDPLQASVTLQIHNINAKSATQEQIMTEIQRKHDYLESNKDKYTYSADKSWGVKDFQGGVHNNSRSYLVAVGKDPDAYNKIDYASDIAKQMKTYLEIDLKQRMPERGMAELNKIEETKLAKKIPKSKAQEAIDIQTKIMQEIEQKNEYLQNWPGRQNDDSWGVKDFQGKRHNFPPHYLVAVAKDPSVYNHIDYDSKIAATMREDLSNHLKCYVPKNCIPELIEMRQLIAGKPNKNIKDNNLTPAEVMQEIEQKNKYLQNWPGRQNDISWGVKDFQGIRHNFPTDYLIAVGKDPSVYNKIDYDSEIGKQIHTDLSDALRCNLPKRCFAEAMEIKEHTGRNIIKEQQQQYAQEHTHSHSYGHER